MFRPGSHELVSVSHGNGGGGGCPAHHSAIDATVRVLEHVCDTVGVAPYNEQDGSGFLRYVCVNVERNTGNVQLTLVWNSVPYHNDNHYCSNDDTQKQQQQQQQQHDQNDDAERRGEGSNETKGDDCTNNGRQQLKDLCDKLISIGTTTTTPSSTNKQPVTKGSHPTMELLSLWVHHNAKWKHSAGIFDFGTTDDTTTNNNNNTKSSSLWKRVYGPAHIIETLDLTSPPSRDKAETSKDDGEEDTTHVSFSHYRPPPCTIPLYFPPNVFRQANLTAFTEIVKMIRSYLLEYRAERNRTGDEASTPMVTTNRSALRGIELYGGVGTIGLHLYDLFENHIGDQRNSEDDGGTTGGLVSSDENPYNKACFDKSIAAMGVNPNCRYVSNNATDMITALLTGSGDGDGVKGIIDADPEILIVDPPRKGLDTAVLEYLIHEPSSVAPSPSSSSTLGETDTLSLPKKRRRRRNGTPPSSVLSCHQHRYPRIVVYVSCGFDAFRRDCDALLGSGRWRLDRAEGHLLFPGSDAIETLAFFRRVA